MCKWLILKLNQAYRPSFEHFEMTSQFLKLETCCDLETFQNMCAWQKKLIDDVIFHFLITSVEIGSWSMNYTSVCDPVNDINCHPSPLSSMHTIAEKRCTLQILRTLMIFKQQFRKNTGYLQDNLGNTSFLKFNAVNIIGTSLHTNLVKLNSPLLGFYPTGFSHSLYFLL